MKRKVYLIGKDQDLNQIYFPDSSISNNHAQIIIDQGNIFLVDLGKGETNVWDEDDVAGRKNKLSNSRYQLKKNSFFSLGSITFTRDSLFRSIQKFESSRNSDRSNSILIETIDNHKTVSKKNKKFNKKLFIYPVGIGVLVLLFFLIKFLIDQNHIKNIIENQTNEYVDSIINSRLDTVLITDKKPKKPKKNKSKNPFKIFKPKKQKENITYDFSCLSDSADGGSATLIGLLGDITRGVQNDLFGDIEITIQDEHDAGTSSYNDLLNKGLLVPSGSEVKKLNYIMDDLVSRIAKPNGYDYKIHYVNDTIENVFTIGARIFFYRGMYDICENDSQLAALISHEIAHNELGHIKLNLKKFAASQRLGPLGWLGYKIEKVVTSAFNQKQEAEADLFGIDLVYPTKFKSCSAVNLWDKLSEKDGEFDISDNFLSTHPHSSKRSDCLKSHLSTNYDMSCD